MFQEFPKVIYLDGDVQAAYLIVNNAEEEAAAEGYMPGKPPAEAEPAKSKKAK